MRAAELGNWGNLKDRTRDHHKNWGNLRQCQPGLQESTSGRAGMLAQTPGPSHVVETPLQARRQASEKTTRRQASLVLAPVAFAAASAAIRHLPHSGASARTPSPSRSPWLPELAHTFSRLDSEELTQSDLCSKPRSRLESLRCTVCDILGKRQHQRRSLSPGTEFL